MAAAGIDGTQPFIVADDHVRAAAGVRSVGDVTGVGAFRTSRCIKRAWQPATSSASHTDAGILIGATSAGPAGGELRGALAVALHAQVPVATPSHMIYAYPTLHRAIEDAIAQLSLRRAGSNHGPP